MKVCLAHKDLYLENILNDFNSDKITATLDQRFLGVVPFTLWNLRRSVFWNASDNRTSKAETQRLFRHFEKQCKDSDPKMLENASVSSLLQESV
jgi:hypothetical protein